MGDENEKVTAKASGTHKGLDKNLRGAVDNLEPEAVKECLDSSNPSDCASERADEAGRSTPEGFAWQILQVHMTQKSGEQQVREYVNNCLNEDDSPKTERPGSDES